MTRLEFVDTHKHELAGLVLEAVTTARERTPEMQAMWLRAVMKRIDAKLASMFDALTPADAAPAEPATLPLRKATP